MQVLANESQPGRSGDYCPATFGMLRAPCTVKGRDSDMAVNTAVGFSAFDSASLGGALISNSTGKIGGSLHAVSAPEATSPVASAFVHGKRNGRLFQAQICQPMPETNRSGKGAHPFPVYRPNRDIGTGFGLRRTAPEMVDVP